MNWLDYTLVAIILSSVLLGFSIGLLEAIFLSLGALFGWILASLIADDIGSILSYAPVLDTWITSISFVGASENFSTVMLVAYCFKSTSLVVLKIVYSFFM